MPISLPVLAPLLTKEGLGVVGFILAKTKQKTLVFYRII